MKKNIVYLYSELMGYQIPIFEELVKNYKCNVHVIHSIQGKMSKYIIPNVSGVTFYQKEDFKQKELELLILGLKPNLVYVSGWMYRDYLKIIFKLRKKNSIVVSGFDDLWLGTLKQRLASLIFPFFKKVFFSHAWVAGPYQYEFARNIGFSKSEIIFNCLSADIDKFNQAYVDRVNVFKNSVPHNFLYVGRFHSIKGVDILIQAWEIISKNNHDWKLTLIGNGTLKEGFARFDNVEILDFMQPENLIADLKRYSCLIIPSRKEQWSVAMHEFAAAGFPIISSSACGALPFFVINNYNGYVYKNNDVKDLAKKMLKIINLNDNENINMSNKSHLLGQRITPQIAAASFFSLLD